MIFRLEYFLVVFLVLEVWVGLGGVGLGCMDSVAENISLFGYSVGFFLENGIKGILEDDFCGSLSF